MKKITAFLTLSILFFCLLNVSAQENADNVEKKNFPLHFGLVYLKLKQDINWGTHGKQSVDYSYNLSLNLLSGKTGGVTGLQISGIYGVVDGNVHGIQIAGLGNAADDVKGIQIGGFGNAADNVTGFQIGGFGNAADKVTGFQIGGFGNAADKVAGIQMGGFGNAADVIKGIQIGGFGNAADVIKGIQIGGFGNAAADVSGIQIAGFGNAAADVKGIQIAGFGNAADKMSGLQIGGAYNRTNTLRGLQIGVVGITDTIEKGISVSIVNIVKRGGYREWELSTADYANVAIGYKMGMRKFYTLYTVGFNFMEDNLWMTGIGFGNRTPIGNRFDFRPELVFCNYFPSDFKDIQTTFATHLKFGFVYRITEKYGLSLSPSVYVMHAKKPAGPDSDDYKISPICALYTKESNNKQVTIGIGVSLGLSFR